MVCQSRSLRSTTNSTLSIYGSFDASLAVLNEVSVFTGACRMPDITTALYTAVLLIIIGICPETGKLKTVTALGLT